MPSRSSWPAGVCIQLFAERIQNADIAVPAATIASRVQRQELGPDDATTSETFRGVAAGMADGLRHLRARRPAARAIGLVMIHRVVFGIALALTA